MIVCSKPHNKDNLLLTDRPNEQQHPDVLLVVMGPDELGVIWLDGDFMLKHLRYKGRKR